MKDIIEELNMLEGGYARLRRILHGIVPSIRTIGFLTAENPMGQQLSSEENEERNKTLETELRSAGYGFYHVKGKYGNEENSFLIVNIPKGNLQDLSAKYLQRAYIFGYKAQYANGDLGMVFENYKTNQIKSFGKLVYNKDGERAIYINKQDAEDEYSEYKGKRFQIPFFDGEDDTDINSPTINKRFSNGRLIDRRDLPIHQEVQEAVTDIEAHLDSDLGKTTEEWKQHRHQVGSCAYRCRKSLLSQVRLLVEYIGHGKGINP